VQKAIRIQEEKVGKETPATARSLQVLTDLYIERGAYAEAEPLARRVLGIRETVFSKDHPSAAETRISLATLYENSGRSLDAEREYLQAIAIQEKALGADHLEVARSLSRIGALYQARGALADAERCYVRALEIRQKAFGQQHPDVADSLDTLAGLDMAKGRFQDAEQRYKAALEIREKMYGQDSVIVADSQHNLGVLYRETGRYEPAGYALRKALANRTSGLHEGHPRVAETARALGVLYAYQGQHKEAHRLLQQNVDTEDREREDVFLLLSEREKLDYVKQTERGMHELLSHTATYLATDEQALTETLNAWLRWKGAVMEAQGRPLQAAMASGDPKVKELFDELTRLRREIAKLQATRPSDPAFAEVKATLAAREKLKDVEEAKLSSLSREFAAEKRAGRADTSRIMQILSDTAIYLDFARVAFRDFEKQAWGEAHYLAFVLTPGSSAPLALIDAGPAAAVDAAIATYLKTMNASRVGYVPKRKALDETAAELYKLLVQPLEARMAGRQQLYVSPDGNLNLVPFEVLRDAKGKYLIESVPISYVAAGRDIVRFENSGTRPAQRPDALILADPDYDFGLSTQERSATSAASTRGSGLTSFARLPDTRVEADEIERILTQRMHLVVKAFKDDKAVEAVLLAAQSPRILHLATHGYFIDREDLKDGSNQTLLKDDPMFRSGLALAGVNLSLKEGKDEGLVSAQKLMGLRLLGTDLVVLSACETGVGDVTSGEGVFGLKRAFILSGARTVVLSLWSVPSEESQQLMTGFYRRMAEGQSKAEALRQSKLELMKDKPNPFFWAAFILVGSPQ